MVAKTKEEVEKKNLEDVVCQVLGDEGTTLSIEQVKKNTAVTVKIALNNKQPFDGKLLAKNLFDAILMQA